MTAIVALAPAPAAAQSAVKSDTGTAYKAPRTAEGQPDLSGVWANNDATPLERPKELQGRLILTDAEVAALRKRAGELFNGETDAAFGDEIYLAALKDAKTFSRLRQPHGAHLRSAGRPGSRLDRTGQENHG
jgi:hypothetical protein